MRTIKSLSRLGVVLASLAVIAVSLAGGASASTAMIPVGGSGDGAAVPDANPVTVVHTVVVGGMPGWQIVAIAAVAALVTAFAAVVIERTRPARRRPVRPVA